MNIAVVIPIYKARDQILDVIAEIGSNVANIYAVDDACPQFCGKLIEAQCRDPRVKVIYHLKNRGVGGAVVSGYKAALHNGADIVVKLDADGQMDPHNIAKLVDPILRGQADYSKGNRFFTLESLASMPRVRILGNSVLSFFNKVVSGYWSLMDPTNGFTAIHARVLRSLPLDKLDTGYFFESDMLFRLNITRAVVKEIPMDPIYRGEHSSLNIPKVVLEFPGKYLIRMIKRIFYRYFLHDFNVCSLQMLSGSALLSFGTIFGLIHWLLSIQRGTPATAGTVILAALPVILGVQLLLAALSFDMMNIPKEPIHQFLQARTSD